MSAVADDIEFDDDTPDAPESAPKKSAKDQARALIARWKTWPMWLRILSVPVGLWVSLIAISFVFGLLASVLGLGGGGGDNAVRAPSAAATSTTVMAVDPLEGLPAVAPLVASSVEPADRVEFRNRVNAVTADGTSLCDVFFGVQLREVNGTAVPRWSVTTPNMQMRSGVGVELPSSAWPVRAFYGGSCDVAAQDVALAAEVQVSSTVLTATTLAAPGE